MNPERDLLIRQMATTPGWAALKRMIEVMLLDSNAVMFGQTLDDATLRFRAGHGAGLHDVLNLLRVMETPTTAEGEEERDDARTA